MGTVDNGTSFAGIKETKISKETRRLGGKRNFMIIILFFYTGIRSYYCLKILKICERINIKFKQTVLFFIKSGIASICRLLYSSIANRTLKCAMLRFTQHWLHRQCQ